MTLTAETVTDEQIRDLRRHCMSGSPWAESCDVALGHLVLDGQDEDEPDIARARCAEIINARRAANAAEHARRASER